MYKWNIDELNGLRTIPALLDYARERLDASDASRYDWLREPSNCSDMSKRGIIPHHGAFDDAEIAVYHEYHIVCMMLKARTPSLGKRAIPVSRDGG